jgi:hypothetical protein
MYQLTSSRLTQMTAWHLYQAALVALPAWSAGVLLLMQLHSVVR